MNVGVGAGLSRRGEQEWDRLRKLLDWSGSFWLSVLFVRSPRPVDALRDRALWNRRWVAAPVNVVRAMSPADLLAAAEKLEKWPPAPGLTWVEGRLTATSDDGEWEAAWTALLAAMNHRRDALRRSAGGIVLVVPDEYRTLVRRVAPDLWSVPGPSPTIEDGWCPPVAEHVGVVEPAATAAGPPWGGSALVAPGEELEPELARRSAALLAEPELDPGAASALVEDALARGHQQLAAVVLNALARAARQRDPARAHAAAARALDLREVDEATRLRTLEQVFEDGLAVGDLDGASVASVRALDIARRLAEALPTPEAQRDLSVSLDNVGQVAQARSRWDEAADAYGQSLDIRRRLAEALPTPQAQRDLSVSLDNVGRVAQARSRWDEAADAYGQSLDIARRLAEALPTPEAQRDLSVSLDNVGRVAQARGRWDEAADAYGQSLDIARRLADQLATPQSQRDLSVSLENVGRVAQARSRWDEAADAYGQSLDIRRRLAEALPTPQAQRDLSISLYNLARSELARGRSDSQDLLAEARAAAESSGDGELLAAIEALAAEGTAPTPG